MWQMIVLTTVLGVFAVVFLTGISLIGLETDPPGGRTERPTPEGDGARIMPEAGGIAAT